jgi:pimeloyl-ACP methyl ester carboxylesterase
MRSTVILVHGAYAESSSWNGVLTSLQAADHRVIAFANPLRSLASDAALLSALVRSIHGSVTLVGHSYGGAVITNVDPGSTRVTGLVYVAGFALEDGESCVDASALVPGSTLAETLTSIPTADDGVDTYIAQDRYHQQFAADLPADAATTMSITQRPVTQAALAEPSGPNPLWRRIPSWFLYGELDRNIPAGAHAIMSERAQARRSVVVSGASHVVGISHPAQTTALILEAASQPALSDA